MEDNGSVGLSIAKSSVRDVALDEGEVTTTEKARACPTF